MLGYIDHPRLCVNSRGHIPVLVQGGYLGVALDGRLIMLFRSVLEEEMRLAICSGWLLMLTKQRHVMM